MTCHVKQFLSLRGAGEVCPPIPFKSRGYITPHGCAHREYIAPSRQKQKHAKQQASKIRSITRGKLVRDRPIHCLPHCH